MKRFGYWVVIVYSGRSHWDKEIGELQESFRTRDGALVYARTIERLNPDYVCEIAKEN